ncbi:MAG: hypothetical protein AAF412_04785 [Pseudomonadota bacterium]
MKTKKQPNEVAGRFGKPASQNMQQPNANTDPRIVLKLKQKRHMSGLMCPPMGAVEASDTHQKR